MEPEHGGRRDAERVLLDIIASVPGYKPPSQARSRETTYAIVSTASALLRERSYASIRMQDIAEAAGCAVTAIYARFPDKSSLLTAIHLLLLQEYRPILDREIKIENFKETGLFGLARSIVSINERFHTENFNYVIAAIKAADGATYRVTANVLGDYGLRLAKVAAPLLNVSAEELVDPMKFGIRFILSTYRESALAKDYFETPSVDSLAHLFTHIIERRLIR